MSFNKKYYKECKAICDEMIHNKPWCYNGEFKDWAEMWVGRIEELEKEDDFEGAKAVKDSLIELLNKLIDEPISKDIIIRLKK